MCLPLLALALTVDGVYVNGHGPYRFLVDTGAQSSVLAPAVARQMGLSPTYRVEVVTVNGTLLAPAAKVTSVSVGKHVVMFPEVISYEPPAPDVDGILGQSYLKHFPYRIDYASGNVVIGPDAEISGIRVPVELRNGQPVVLLDGFSLALDSGASAMVLFRAAPGWRPSRGFAKVATASGESNMIQGSLASLAVGGVVLRNVPAVLAAGNRHDIDGLLPLNLFASVYINAAEGYAIFRCAD